MRLVDLKCPNCSENLVKEGDNFVCRSCGGSFAVDYDSSDIEHERIKAEAEQEQRKYEHEKELLEKEYELKEKAEIASEKRRKSAGASVKTVFFVLIFLIICVVIYNLVSGQIRKNDSGDYGKAVATPTPVPDYGVTSADVEGQLNNFIISGEQVQKNISKCVFWDQNGPVDNYSKTGVEFVDAYLVTNIPNVGEKESNRLVLIYKVNWNNDEKGEQICYDGVYFQGLQVNPNGGIISDFAGHTIQRSEAAWGWMQAYSFEKYEQCYLENVTSLGGTVTKLDNKKSTVSE